MKKIWIPVLCLGLFFAGLQSLAPQEEQQEPQSKAPEEIFQKRPQKYFPGDRRDPFKDLLAGREVEEKTGKEGIKSYMIDDILLIGIVEIRDKFLALINGPQGFPYKIRVGDEFANGFVLSIDSSKVVLRQTRDRGVPLTRPRDITKEINPEER